MSANTNATSLTGSSLSSQPADKDTRRQNTTPVAKEPPIPPPRAGGNTVSANLTAASQGGSAIGKPDFVDGYEMDDRQSQDLQPRLSPRKFKLEGAWATPLTWVQGQATSRSSPAFQSARLVAAVKGDLVNEPPATNRDLPQHQNGDNNEQSDSSAGWQIVGPRGRALRRLQTSAAKTPPSHFRLHRPHAHGHPQVHKSPLPPGASHRAVFDLDSSKLTFGKIVHTDKSEELEWSDRPAVVVGVNQAARRVRFWCIFSYSDAGGLAAKYNNSYYVGHPLREHYMRNSVLIHDGWATPHLGTPEVYLTGTARRLGKTSYVDISEVRELPFERVCAQSLGHVLQDMWLSVEDMLRLRKQVERQGNSLIPTVEGGRLNSYPGKWEGFCEYTIEVPPAACFGSL